MRARNLKPGLFKNELLGSADPLITILFAGLWCSADREGRLEDRPLRLCAEVFPYRRAITEKKVNAWLDWLQTHGFIVRYRVGDERFIQVLEFLTHQNPHRDERMSTIPALSTVSHGGSTVNAQCDLDKSPELARLNPESGILNPESSLRETRARAASKPPAGRRGRNGGPDPDPHAAYHLRVAIEAIYPPGMYGAQNWILAEREISKLLDGGESAESLLACVRAFRAQQDAKASTGTQYVKSPENFFGEGHWRGPFPVPQAALPKRIRTATDIAEEYEARERANAAS